MAKKIDLYGKQSTGRVRRLIILSSSGPAILERSNYHIKIICRYLKSPLGTSSLQVLAE
jgi:hypothetical protein